MLRGRIRPFALATGIALAVAAIVAGGVAAPATAATSVGTAVARILADTNALRAQNGLLPLLENPAIDTVAQNWANQLGGGATFAHNPSFFSQMPSGADTGGENIAGGFLYATVVNSGWANSPGHLANMLGSYTDVGIGYYESADGRTAFAVQDFGHYPAHVAQQQAAAASSPTASPTPAPTPSAMPTASATPSAAPSPTPTPSSIATIAAASAPPSSLVPLSSLPAPVASTASAPIPKVVGNRLVDSRSGSTWVAHAVNWPSFEYACQQGWAYAQDGRTDAAAKAMVSWGINAVRLPLNEDCWLGTDGSPRYGNPAGYQQAVRQWVDILNANGIVVILDLHWSGGTGLDSSGQRPFLDDQSPLFWEQVSYAFSKVPSVMFDAFNEPYSTGSYQLTWSCWLNGGCAMPTVLDGQTPGPSTYTTTGMKDVVAAIRSAGAAQPVLLGGLDYSNDLRGWLANRPSDSQLVASWHNYPGQRCQTVGCWNSEIAPVAAQVPVITTEFGETDGGTSFLTTFMNWADSKGIGYSPWAWWWTDSSDSAEANAYALIQNGSFTPKAPEGTAYYAHLTGQAPISLPSGSPIGGIDLSVGASTVNVHGWTIDPDTASSIQIAIYVDGVGTAVANANASRPDVASAFPGYGASHGIDTSLVLSPGAHTVCAYGLNVGAGGNALLGCAVGTAPNRAPFGGIDTSVVGTRIAVHGWSIDPDTITPINVALYVDGVGAAVVAASASRPDVAAAFAGFGAAHGIDTTLDLAPGPHTVCAYGLNVGPGQNSLLSCSFVVAPNRSPIGGTDVTADGPGVVLRGWAIDPDTTGPVNVAVYVDGVGAVVTTASADRQDVAAVYPAYGATHGIQTRIALTAGTHQICSYGLNVGAGANALLGCQTVTI